MANLELTIKKGCFAEASGPVKVFTPKKVIGMGWFVVINEDGTLEATCKERTKEGIYSLKAVLKPGSFFSSKRIMFPDGTYKNIEKKEYKISSINGVLGLSDGTVNERYIYYENEGLRRFKKEFEIEKIIKTNPNRIYEFPISSEIYTDGVSTKSINNSKCFFKVHDASWVLIETASEEKKGWKVRQLYSLKRYNALELPKLLSSAGRKEFANSFTRKFKNLQEAVKYIEKLNLFEKNVYECEGYEADREKVHASYFLNKEGILVVYLSRVSFWNTRESLEASGVPEEMVKEGRDYFSKTDRILEGKAYVEI